MLAEPTNDAWFGGGSGNVQHFQMDRIRAIETDRYLLRTANTGITAIIDSRGRVLARLPQNQPGALPGNFAPLETMTPYVRLGDWAVFAAMLIALGFAWAALPEQRS